MQVVIRYANAGTKNIGRGVILKLKALHKDRFDWENTESQVPGSFFVASDVAPNLSFPSAHNSIVPIFSFLLPLDSQASIYIYGS